MSSGWLSWPILKCVFAQVLRFEPFLAQNLSWWKLEHNSFFWIGLAKWRMTSTKVYLKARKIDNNASVKQKKSESELKVIWEPLYLLKLCYNLKCGHKEIYILSSLSFIILIYVSTMKASNKGLLDLSDVSKRWKMNKLAKTETMNHTDWIILIIIIMRKNKKRIKFRRCDSSTIEWLNDRIATTARTRKTAAGIIIEQC